MNTGNDISNRKPLLILLGSFIFIVVVPQKRTEKEGTQGKNIFLSWKVIILLGCYSVRLVCLELQGDHFYVLWVVFAHIYGLPSLLIYFSS